MISDDFFMVKQLKKSKTIATKNDDVKIFYQNICGLRNKYNEILCHLEDITPQLLCLTEHRLREEEIAHLNQKNYILDTYYCRKIFMKGGTCIYVVCSKSIEPLVSRNTFIDLEVQHPNPVQSSLLGNAHTSPSASAIVGSTSGTRLLRW
jgi:hypothetical protein